MIAPYYDDGTCVIYHGRCEEVIPTLAPVDLVFTSPPYNLGVTAGGGFGHWQDGQLRGGYGKWAGPSPEGGIIYDNHDDALDIAEYEVWQATVLHLLWERLTDVGAIFYNHKPRVQAKELWNPLRMCDLPVRQIITWDRGSGMNFAPTHYVPAYEWIIVYAKPAWRLRDKAVSGLMDVWRVPPDVGNPHPAPFPVALPARAMESTPPGVVLDPFMGSGSTLRAAKNFNRRAIGIDKSERYCEMAAKRLAQEVLDFGGAA